MQDVIKPTADHPTIVGALTIAGVAVDEGRHGATGLPYWEFTHPRTQERLVLVHEEQRLTVSVDKLGGDHPWCGGAYDTVCGDDPGKAREAAFAFINSCAEITGW